MKRIHIIGITLIIVLVGAGLWYWLSYLPSTDQAQNIVLATPVPPQFGYWEITYAQDAGYFDEYNLNASFVVVRTASEMMQAVVSGEADFAYGVSDTLRAQLAGGTQLRIVYVASLAPFSVIARSGIETIQEIKVIAHSTGRGSDGDVLFDQLLPRYGLTLNVDYTKVYISRDALVPGLQNAEFDACSAGSNSYTLLEIGATQLLKFADEFPQWLTGGLCCDESKIEPNFEVYKNYMKAMYRSQTYLMEHRDEAIEYAINTLELDPEYAEYIYDFSYGNKYGAAYKITPGMPLDDIEYTMKICANWTETEEMPIADLVDTSIWDQAKQELGV